MSENIIVAGAGHGGLAAAAILARNGFEVTVYEKRKRKGIGYDWTDTFDLYSLEAAQIKLPDDFTVEKSTNITFVPPSENIIIVQDIDEESLTVKIERRELYDILIKNAEDAGVKLVFGCEIKAPLFAGDRVVGVETDKHGKKYADLVIDACGHQSVIRKNMPDCLGIQKELGKNESFYVYRGLFEKGKEALHKYKVYLMPDKTMGIGWVISDKKYCDVLIGEFEPIDQAEVDRKLAFFRRNNSVLGKKLLRGGEFAEIPVRQTLSIIVADGYAAIGDSAFMTVPLLGSGISNSLKAAAILSDVIINDETKTYSAETLWDYQKRYFEEIGSGMAKMAIVKCMLPKLTAEQVDYAFEKELITRDELTISSGGFNLDTGIFKKAIALIKDKSLIGSLAGVGKDMGLLTAALASMPEDFSRKKVLQWAARYDKLFESNENED